MGLRFSRCPGAYNHASLFPLLEQTFDKGKMKRNVNPEFVSQDMQGGEREKKRDRDLAGFSYKVIRKINPKILIRGIISPLI